MGKVLPSRLALLAGHNLLILRYAPSLWGIMSTNAWEENAKKIRWQFYFHGHCIGVGFLLGLFWVSSPNLGVARAWHGTQCEISCPPPITSSSEVGLCMGMAWAGSWHSMGSGMGASAQICALHGSYPRACCCCFEVMAATPLGFSRVTMVFLVVLWGLRCRLGISWASHEILIGPSRVQEKP
jgi:hypothetical protein